MIDSKGFIAAIDNSTGSALADEVDTLVREGKVGQDKVVELGDGWALPGFVDTHSESFQSSQALPEADLAVLASSVHAPQYPNAGMALDKPLMEWVRSEAPRQR